MAAEDKTKKLASTAAAFFGALAEFLNEEAKAPAVVTPAEAAPAAKPAAAPKKAAAATKVETPPAAAPAETKPAASPAPEANGKEDPGAVMAKCRTALSEYAKTYGREGVRALLDKYGAAGKALSDVPVENFPALLAEASA